MVLACVFTRSNSAHISPVRAEKIICAIVVLGLAELQQRSSEYPNPVFHALTYACVC